MTTKTKPTAGSGSRALLRCSLFAVLLPVAAALLRPPVVPAAGSAETFDAELDAIYEGRSDVISGAELYELLHSERDAGAPRVYLLDTRSEAEWRVSRLPEAEFVGYDGFSLDAVAHIPRDAAVVVYCAVGWRSGRVETQLRNAGFVNVRDLYGGIFGWVNEQLPVVDAAGETLRVHGYSRRWGRWIGNPQIEVVY